MYVKLFNFNNLLCFIHNFLFFILNFYFNFCIIIFFIYIIIVEICIYHFTGEFEIFILEIFIYGIIVQGGVGCFIVLGFRGRLRAWGAIIA